MPKVFWWRGKPLVHTVGQTTRCQGAHTTRMVAQTHKWVIAGAVPSRGQALRLGPSMSPMPVVLPGVLP